jgi:pyrroloquinoline quinone (PQQ) biosynthesis protein C
MLGSVHVLEGMSTVLADKAAETIQRSLALSGDKGFTYLRSHGALDIEHVAFFHKLADALPQSAHAVVIETSQIIYRLYGDIFRELALRHPGRRDAA